MLDRINRASNRVSSEALPLLARFTFAAVLFRYFWGSALTKLDGVFTPSLNAYAQIFPKQMEAIGYDVTLLGPFHWLVVIGGTYAEFILPVLIVLGLFTRLAALGMIGFVIVQSLTDIVGHGLDATTVGAWFDRASGALVMDQRAYWVLGLLILVGLGGGKLSLDRFVMPKLLARFS